MSVNNDYFMRELLKDDFDIFSPLIFNNIAFDVKEDVEEESEENNVFKVFICSPFRGDVLHNVKKAREYCRFYAKLNGKHSPEVIMPVCPHIYFPQFLNDKDEKERELGITLGKELLKECDLVVVYDVEKGVTAGMRAEIDLAQELGKHIIYESKIDLYD